MKPGIIPTQQEVRFENHELIVSKTDTTGRLTYANRVFMRVANFSEDALLGKPHNVIRHPDMPRGAFRLLWKTLAQGREWFGFVKNMTADGGYYWVFANVTPDRVQGRVIGYYSVRRQAPKGAIAEIEPIYRQMCVVEAQAGKKDAPDASIDWLGQQLAARGVSYEQFVLDCYKRHLAA